MSFIKTGDKQKIQPVEVKEQKQVKADDKVLTKQGSKAITAQK